MVVVVVVVVIIIIIILWTISKNVGMRLEKMEIGRSEMFTVSDDCGNVSFYYMKLLVA